MIEVRNPEKMGAPAYPPVSSEAVAKLNASFLDRLNEVFTAGPTAISLPTIIRDNPRLALKVKCGQKQGQPNLTMKKSFYAAIDYEPFSLDFGSHVNHVQYTHVNIM